MQRQPAHGRQPSCDGEERPHTLIAPFDMIVVVDDVSGCLNAVCAMLARPLWSAGVVWKSREDGYGSGGISQRVRGDDQREL